MCPGALLILLLGGIPAAPDIAPSPLRRSSDGLAPAKPTAVAMVAETVTITVHEDRADVRAVFDMRNTAAETEELEVGFPSGKPTQGFFVYSEEAFVWREDYLEDFQALVDGERVEARRGVFREKTLLGNPVWLCWPMRFEPGQARRVEVSYGVVTRDDFYTPPSPLRNREVTYVLKTGAGWHGPIGSAEVILELGSRDSRHIVDATPRGYTIDHEGPCLRWKWKDLEPDFDILVRYRVFADAEDAVARIAPKVEEIRDRSLLLDLGAHFEALGRHEEAARVFERLHDSETLADERVGSRTLRDYVAYSQSREADRSYVPPAMLAARNHRLAGEDDLAAVWAKRAIDRLEEVRALHSLRGTGTWTWKLLRVPSEKIDPAVALCRKWIGYRASTAAEDEAARAYLDSVRAHRARALALAAGAGVDPWTVLDAWADAVAGIQEEYLAARRLGEDHGSAFPQSWVLLQECTDRRDALVERLETDAYEAARPWRDLLSATPGGGQAWTTRGALRCEAREQTLVLEGRVAEPAGGGFLVFDDGTGPWRDFVFELEFEIDPAGFEVHLRHQLDGIRAIDAGYPAEFYPFAPGERHTLHVRARGSMFTGGVDGTGREDTTLDVLTRCQGTVAIKLPAGTRMIVHAARLKLLLPRD